MRHERRAVLGSGATGTVYRVWDRELRQELALKTLHGVSADSEQRLKFEFRVLRGITHPSLVQLYDLVIEDGEAFFTMELIEGRDLVTFIRGDHPPLAPLDGTALQRLRDVFGQLAAGIIALHDGGRVHRDLKPANILVTDLGQVRLLDFGFAAALLDDNPDEASIAGTLPYMAPEQIWGMPLTPAMDWYALGVILWEALTGVACFEGSPASILRTKEQGPITGPRQRVPGTNAGLDALVRVLLEADPRRRPTAAAIVAALAGHDPPAAATAPAAPAEAYVGREAELGVLADWLNSVAPDRPRIGHVIGPSGIGKTTLGRRFCAQAPALVLWSSCHPQETVPYKALDGAIDDLARYLRHHPAAASLQPHDPEALTSIFPALASVEALATPGQSDVPDPRERRRRAFAALRALIGAVSQQRPVVMWIDDAQWGDRDSLQALIEVLRGPHAPRVLVVLAYRREAAATAAFVHELARVDLGPSATIEIGALPAEQSRVLAARLLQRGAEDGLVQRVVEQAAGSPFLVEQLSGYLRDPGEETRSVQLADAILGQIDRLGEAARAVAELVSVAGGALDLAHLLPLARTPGAMPLVYRMREQRVLRTPATRPKSIEIYHDRIRETLLAALPVSRREALHRQVAVALRSQPDANPEALLEHLLGAGDRTGAAPAAVAAAEHNVAVLAFARAAELYAVALELRATGDADWSLMARHGEALANAGMGGAAGRAYVKAADAAAGVAAPAADVLSLRAAAARELLCAGEYAPGTVALTAMLTAAGLSYPRRPLTALATLLLARARIAARGLESASRGEAGVPARKLAQIDACWAATIGLNAFDAVRSAAFQSRHTLLALDGGDPVRVVRALTAEAVYRAAEGRQSGRDRAAALITRVDRLAREVGDPRTRAFARLCAGVASYFAGNWTAAIAQLAEAEEIFRQLHGVGWEINNCRAYRLWALSWMGTIDRFLSEQREANAEAQGRDDALAAIGSASGHANLAWLFADRPDEARAAAALAISPFPYDAFQSPHYADFIAQARIDLYQGDAWAAWQRHRETLPRLRRIHLLRLQLFRVEVWLLSGTCALAAAAAGPPPRAMSRWTTPHLLRAAAGAAGRLRAEDLPAAGALADLLDAARAAFAGIADGAVADAFTHAADALERHGLGLYATAARGRAAVARGGAWSEREHWPDVRAPQRLAAMLIPDARRG